MVNPVTPLPCESTQVVTGGTAVTAVPVNPAGGFIQNPQSADDQAIVTAEVMYVDPINAPGSAPGAGNGTCFVLYPGQTWSIIAGQTTQTRVNAGTSGHKFSGVFWR